MDPDADPSCFVVLTFGGLAEHQDGRLRDVQACHKVIKFHVTKDCLNPPVGCEI